MKTKNTTSQSAKGAKAEKNSKKETAATVATPASKKEEGLIIRAAELPEKVRTAIGTVAKVAGQDRIVTHVGAVAVREGWGKPQELPVKKIVALLKDGHSVLAARTCRHLTLKKMAARANQDGIKAVIVIAKK